nr:MAG TPA: hypothetical protein [Bacteriophage sp.]
MLQFPAFQSLHLCTQSFLFHSVTDDLHYLFYFYSMSFNLLP